jgi:hypothetical protein
MEVIRAFEVAALKSGFVEMDECGDGTVVWLRRASADAVAETPQRICIDTLTNSATVYWTNIRGKTESKTFRRVPAFQEWMSNSVLVEQLSNVVPESLSPAGLPSAPALSIAIGVGKRAS